MAQAKTTTPRRKVAEKTIETRRDRAAKAVRKPVAKDAAKKAAPLRPIGTLKRASQLPDPVNTYRRLQKEASTVSIKSLKWNTIRYTLKDVLGTAVIVGLVLTVLYLASLVMMFAFGA